MKGTTFPYWASALGAIVVVGFYGCRQGRIGGGATASQSCQPGQVCDASDVSDVSDARDVGEACQPGQQCDSSCIAETEVCDGYDNDCDDLVDEGLLSACGTCDASCPGEIRGVGGAEGWPDPQQSNDGTYQGVDVDPIDGALTLGSQSMPGAAVSLIWIANTGEGTVSKVDTGDLKELARYRVGPTGAADDPSRTSVNAYGDVYVGNRAQSSEPGRSVTKISARGEDCPDTNGDNEVTTSAGPADVLDWEKDDCVLWRTLLPGGGKIRAVAAQDSLVGTEVRQFVWVGGFGKVTWKLDGETGEVLVETPSPTNNYGFALDGRGNLWISGRGDDAIGRIDTNRCVSNSSCDAPVCSGAAGDDCIKQIIPLGTAPYGITVDSQQRVWVAAMGSSSIARYVFDKSVAWADRLTLQWVGQGIHGIAADGAGWVWGAANAAGVVRMNGNDMPSYTIVAGTEDEASKGMAVDFAGKIWSINRGDSATVIEAGATLDAATVSKRAVTGLVDPYTYSDMTGQQLRLATGASGYFRQLFFGCEQWRTLWEELSWQAAVPTGTGLIWRVRSAATRDALGSASWHVAGEVPGAVSPIDLGAVLAAAGVESGQWLEVEVQLYTTPESPGQTPRVTGFGVSLALCQDPPV